MSDKPPFASRGGLPAGGQSGASGGPSAAKRIILNLLDSAHDGALVPIQDGGVHVDIVYSRRKGSEGKVMTLAESEKRIDTAIRAAWRALTEQSIPKGFDPVEWVEDLPAIIPPRSRKGRTKGGRSGPIKKNRKPSGDRDANGGL